ncbi:uncharacterized protein [Branchiostoma lanceolatum]|uniref:uncharacterized protein n=1 Tax=Branchiostoma lanceolatum TaxID=7740 RepID=UPI003454F5B8
MFGAGKRKTRRPTRFADYRFEDDIWSEHAGDRSRSPAGFSQAPSERLEEEIEEQLAEVSRTIERLQLTEARVADRHTSPKSSPPLLPTGPRYDDVSRTSLSRGLGRDDLPTASRPQEELETASRRQGDRGAYPLDYGLPSLYDIRADRHGKQGARPKYSPPPLPTDDIPTSYPRTLSREFGKDGRGARGTAFPTAARRQEDRGASQFDSGYPSLHDIRAMNYLKDPKTSADRTFRTKKGQPNPRSPHDRKSDVAVQSRFEPSRDYSPDSDDDRPFREAAWRTLQQDTLRTQRSAFAASTQANHKTHFTAYLAFCRFFKKQPLPATAHLLSCYAQFLSRSLRSPASISHYLSSVKLLHQHHGFFDFDLKHFELQQTLKGLKRQLQHRPREHHPVTPEFLLKAHQALDLHNAKDATIWAIILIGFFAYFRKSNLVPSTAKTFNPNRHLCRRDIAVATEGLLLRTSWSKTIQANERELLTPVLAIPGSRLCPVTAYNNMVRLVPATQDSPAFQLPPTPHRHFRPVTSSILEKAFAKLVAAANLPAGYHTLHDLRRGGYTLPRELRQRHGDWRSNADLLYLQPSMEQRLRLPVAMRSLLRRRTT